MTTDLRHHNPSMPTSKAILKTLKAFGLSLPGTTPKSPWPGHDDVAVNDKTFVYLSLRTNGGLAVSVKLPVNAKEALKLPNASPTGYGLGKSGWVSLSFGGDDEVPVDTIKRWMMESYRAQAPKRVMKELEAQQPWVKAGGLPG